MRFLLLLIILFPILSSAFQLDWSGYYKANVAFIGHGSWDPAVYQSVGETTPFLFYDEQQLFLNAKAHISDGLLFQTNFLLGSVDRSSGNSVGFIDSSRRKISLKSFQLKDIRLLPTHFYATYSNEFVQVDIGRQPFNFGLGMTYSDGFHPLAPAYDVRDALAVKIQHESFYIKPYAIVHSQDEVAGFGASWAVAGGYEADNMTAEFLYKSKNYKMYELESTTFSPKPFVNSHTFNLYGEYTEGPITASAEWGFMDSTANSAGFAHVSWNTSFYNTKLTFIGGYVSNESYVVNINYDPTFMFWGYYYIVSGIDRSVSGPNNCFILAPYASVDITDKHTAYLYHVWISDNDTLNFKNHELSFITKHKIAKGFSWFNKFGVLFKGSNLSDYGIKTEAIISF